MGVSLWILNKAMTKSINGCYTRMLRMAQNVSWRDHIINLELYGNIPALSEKIGERWLCLAGHNAYVLLVTVYGTQIYPPIKSSCRSPLTAGVAPEDPPRPCSRP